MRRQNDFRCLPERAFTGHRTINPTNNSGPVTIPEAKHISAYVGRFAPSPTGDLHFGSLVAAVASFLQARHVKGRWLVRIEDIDPPREVPGSATAILSDLDRLGLRSDVPVLYQGRRTEAYEAAVEQLLREDKAYWCGCTRKDLPPSGIYPGTCRNGLAQGKSPRSVRLKVDGAIINFSDLIQGNIEDNLTESVGDFVIRRADRLPAYQLAVAVDDAYQGITEVVRGADLLDSTTRQIHVQHCLGLETPAYAHHPLATHEDGRKLGKRYGSDPVARLSGVEAIRLALNFLGQPAAPEMKLENLWHWAIENWKSESIPRTVKIPLPDHPLI